MYVFVKTGIGKIAKPNKVGSKNNQKPFRDQMYFTLSMPLRLDVLKETVISVFGYVKCGIK